MSPAVSLLVSGLVSGEEQSGAGEERRRPSASQRLRSLGRPSSRKRTSSGPRAPLS